MKSELPLERLEERLGYSFSDKGLLEEALTHSSFANEQSEPTPHNERLEFLGDAVLDLVLSERLMERFREAAEGSLSKIRAYLVNEAALAKKARALGLSDYLRLGRGERLTGGTEKASVLAGAYEALAAAIYLDAGYEEARAVLLSQYAKELELGAALVPIDDYKSLLQERCQEAAKGLPVYTLVRERGPDHAKTFEVEVDFFGGMKARGVGKNKKEAEQAAANRALDQLARKKPYM